MFSRAWIYQSELKSAARLKKRHSRKTFWHWKCPFLRVCIFCITITNLCLSNFFFSGNSGFYFSSVTLKQRWWLSDKYSTERSKNVIVSGRTSCFPRRMKPVRALAPDAPFTHQTSPLLGVCNTDVNLGRNIFTSVLKEIFTSEIYYGW